VLDAAGADKAVRQGTYLVYFPADDEDFQAAAPPEVYVEGGYDDAGVFVLDVGEFLLKVGDVVVVNQRDGPDRGAAPRFPRFLRQVIPD
jgi:hypothetical protein